MGPKAYLFRSELDRIAGFVAAYPRLETGGNLFGYRTNSGAPVVCIATGPGRAAEHHATAFYQDADYLETCGRLLFERFALQHVGEWHSHHRLGLQRPSAGDEATVFKCMEPMRWSSFMLGIANLDTRGKPSIGFFQLDASRRACTQLEVEVLDRASPLSLARALLPPGERSPNVAYGGGCEVRQPEHPWYERRGVSARLARELKGLAVLRDQAGYRFRLHPRGASLHLDLETPAGLAYRLGPRKRFSRARAAHSPRHEPRRGGLGREPAHRRARARAFARGGRRRRREQSDRARLARPHHG